jgi:hypothetical protein
MSRWRPVVLAAALVTRGAPAPLQAQILETETARSLGSGVFEVSGNLEYQTSSEGRETAVPFAVEYGLTNRLELLVEPVAWTAISPKAGMRATGVGDVEVTLTWLARAEAPGAPAFALAAEVKAPTARDSLIGTRKTDIAGYLIASRRWGRLDAHANVSYTVVGQPAGADLKNIVGFAIGGEWAWNTSNDLFGEVLANTAASSSPEPAPGTVSVTPEAPGGEVSVTVGVAHRFLQDTRAFLGISADNNGAVLFHPGFTVRFR